MLLTGALLNDGPPPHAAPAWIRWALGPDAPVVHESADDVPDVEEEDEEDRWVPFLQPRRKRARGQTQTNVVPDGDDSSDSSVDSGSETPEEPCFPYPCGTKVARDFGEAHGVFEGFILDHYADDPTLCIVRYTDGDEEDMDKDEVSYAVELYQREFVMEEAD